MLGFPFTLAFGAPGTPGKSTSGPLLVVLVVIAVVIILLVGGLLGMKLKRPRRRR